MKRLCPVCHEPFPGGDAARHECRSVDASGALDLSDSDLGADSAARTRQDEAAGALLATSDLATFGRYRIAGELGQGGMGKVYLAEDPQLGRRVALKVVLAGTAGSEARQRFLREARATARLEHPHIVRIHDIGEEQGQPYFTMEYVEGKSLERLLADGLPLARGLSLLAKTARAVSFAHGQGVIHRDLKPANIMVDTRGEPRVMDFGLARLVEDEGPALSRSGSLVGTPAYMSPEQADRRTREVDPRSDVWALGAILYEIATGRRPFSGTEVQVLSRIVNEDPVPPRAIVRTLPADVETIALKALEKGKERRYPTAAAFAEDIERHLAGEPILARPLTTLERSHRWVRRHRFATGAAVLFALTAAGILVASALIQEKGEEVRAETAAEVLTDTEAKAREGKIAELRNDFGRFGDRLDVASREKADLVTFDSLAADFARLSEEARRLSVEPPMGARQSEVWQTRIAMGVARGIIEGLRAQRYDEARRLLEPLAGGEGPLAAEAIHWRARLAWDSLPEGVRQWPDPHGVAPVEEPVRKGIEEALRWAGRAAEKGEGGGIEGALQEAKLLLSLGHAPGAAERLAPFRDGARDLALRDPEKTFELFRGLVLAETLREPPNLDATLCVVSDALVLWQAPDLAIEDRALIVRVVHPAALLFWERWLAEGWTSDLERIREWLDPAYEASQMRDWKAAGACDLPWMLGISLLVLEPAGAGSRDPFDLLGNAVSAGYQPSREPRYEDKIAGSELDRFRKKYLDTAAPAGEGGCR
ncbi:MAG: serine/threonine protein kinase [Planctomycetes bacterium]|nr:serine/threonine protein kinase [Planctomycetota bacterium]